MSGAPKRPHEEGGHSSSKYSHEDVGGYPKLSSTISSEYHPPYETSQDSRLPKIPRTESRDLDRRSPLHQMYRMPSSSSNDPHVSHSAPPDNRMESRDPKESREVRVESRDLKTESRDLYGQSKRDSQNAKTEKDVRHDSRSGENKETRHDRESYYESKGGAKMEKESYGAATGQFNWKDPKDYHRGKRYSEASGGSMDPSWHISRGNSQGPVEAGKEGPSSDQRDHTETHEAVGENKVDAKVEDKYKDKDKKRKDVKHRDWGERDKEGSDHRVSIPVSSSSNECKKSSKEEGEVDRWDVERKDLSKGKERPKEREKDQSKQEQWNGVKKEGLHNESNAGDPYAKVPEQENLITEHKKQEDSDGLKNDERDTRDRKKEKDSDVDVDRSEKQVRGHDKEPEDGYVDGEGTNEKEKERDREREREVFGYGVQQRKRMLRPRGSPQVANREPRFRSRAADNDGSQGKPEVSIAVYKVGECIQDLTKLWKEYDSSQAEKNGESSQNGPTLEIQIPAEHVTATNRQVRGGQLWGTDIYTYDSDLVAVLMHTGYCRPTASPPPPAIQELRATIRVLPPQDCYISTLRNNVRSRAWGAAIGCSYRVERCCIVKKGGGTIDLEPCLTYTSTVEPTLAPVAVERTMTTRAAASNALRQQRFVREVTIQYNLCNEPWIKYSISIVADKGLKKPLYTSARLKKGEVLYLETHRTRYELCFAGEKVVKANTASLGHDGEADKSQSHHSQSTNGEKNESDNTVVDLFRWSRCKKPLPQKVMRSIGIPLPLEHVEVLEENLDWEDVEWSQTGVWIAGKEYTLARVHFLSMN